MQLLSAHELKAADKSGTSDPYVVFTVNGEKVYRSEMIRKTLNPTWTGERFSVPIVTFFKNNVLFVLIFVIYSNRELLPVFV